MIEETLPRLKEDVNKLLSSCNKDISALPPPLENDPQTEVLERINVSNPDLDSNLADESREVPKLRNKLYEDFKLERADWTKLGLVYDVLKEPATAQQSFSSAKHPTAWRTIPTLECLANRWRSMADDPKYGPIADAIKQGLKNVDKYYKKARESDVYFICLVLDPNFKLAYVESQWSPQEVASGRARLKAVFDAYYQPCTAPQEQHCVVAPESRDSVYGEAWMREAVAAHQNATRHHGGRDPRDELTAYLSSPLEDMPDIVAWWGLHSLQYPTLSRIARDYLPIQGSAVPSERAFSSGGITSTLRRNSLASSTFSALQLLKAAYNNGHISAVSEAQGYTDMLGDFHGLANV